MHRAGSQRLRDVINKGLNEEIILHGCGLAFEGGWNKVKLYFMLGLPTEQVDDMKAIAELANRIAVRYYEIPKDQKKRKMPDYGQHFFLCAKTVYTVPVVTDVYQRGILKSCQNRQRYRKKIS